MEDHQIVELYWKRDPQAIRETENKYGHYLTKIALNILADLEDSKESVNDTLFKSLELYAASQTGDPGNLSGQDHPPGIYRHFPKANQQKTPALPICPLS